ncbi:MAG: histidine kinase [Lachnospiraceae bacterium]|jgi:two-component system sensor histidine kinase YesM|nr:histidine kinase [Lachnospiraceae bacterium]
MRFLSGIVENFKERFKSLPMRQKMTVSYFVPSFLLLIATNMVIYPFLVNNYGRELKKNIRQSIEQAEAFTSNYANDMMYIAQLVSGNSKIDTLLSRADYSRETDITSSYREFYNLNNAFAELQLTNSTFHIGIYLPDSAKYTNNNFYFFPESELRALPDYSALMQKTDSQQLYYTTVTERRSNDPLQQDIYIVAFSQIAVTDPEGEGQKYTIKVEILESALQKILLNAVNVEGSLLYLTNNENRLLAVSDRGLYDRLQCGTVLSQEETAAWQKQTIAGREYYELQSDDAASGWRLNCLIPVSSYNRQLSSVWVMLILSLVVLVVVIFVISRFLARYYTDRLSRLAVRMQSLQPDNFSQKLPQQVRSGDEIDEIYSSYNYMTDRIRQLMKEQYRLGKKVTSIQLSALQAQINPHFLYNTLDLINWGAMDAGADTVAQIAKDLGTFYRLSLNHGRSAILIRDELKHVQAYVNIENVHFAAAINLDMQVPEEICGYACPNIILQPFVENAIVHGIVEIPDIIECNITITAKTDGTGDVRDILFEIQDDGPGMSEETMKQLTEEYMPEQGKGYGVRNINFRIKLCYGDRYGVRFEKSDTGGTRVLIRIRAMSLEELEQQMN